MQKNGWHERERPEPEGGDGSSFLNFVWLGRSMESPSQHHLLPPTLNLNSSAAPRHFSSRRLWAAWVRALLCQRGHVMCPSFLRMTSSAGWRLAKSDQALVVGFR